MDTAERLRALISGGMGTPEEAERAARAAEALAGYLRAERTAAEVLGDVQQLVAAPAGVLENMTLHDAAERVLSEAGMPLHVRDLGTRIKAGGWSHPRSRNARPDQINYQLAARLARMPDRFRRVAPNTFGLAQWDDGSTGNRRKPRLGMFRSGGATPARSLDGDAPFEEQPWRSS